MTTRIFLATITATVALYGQWGGSQMRRADIRGGGGNGKCTIEVEVDDMAEVEIRGGTANLRTRSGRRATWRRFQCNQVMPLRPYSFRFRGIDGRGRQTLVRDPGDGGPAVIRIDDPRGGREGYTFDVEWRGGDGGGGGRGRGNTGGTWGNGNRAWDGGDGGYGGGYSGGNSGAYNDGYGGGWNGRAGSTFQFRGDGNGAFDRRNGRDGRVRDVEVRLDRDGRVMLSFEAEGYRRLDFAGRADRFNRDSISADLRSSNATGAMAGAATIYLDQRGEVERIEMSGRTRGDEFRLRWRAR